MSSDDEPLSSLKNAKPKVEEPEKPKDEPVKPKDEPKTEAPAPAAAALGDDSEDDMPLASLVSKKTIQAKVAASRGEPEKKRPAPERQTRAADTSEKKRRPPSESRANMSKKDVLIDKILCRWWYAFDWPGVDWPSDEVIDAMPDKPDENWTPMTAFPWIFENAKGMTLNLRNTPERTPPCYAKLSKMSESELKEKLRAALLKQIEVLTEHEGATAQGMAELRRQLRKVDHR